MARQVIEQGVHNYTNPYQYVHVKEKEVQEGANLILQTDALSLDEAFYAEGFSLEIC